MSTPALLIVASLSGFAMLVQAPIKVIQDGALDRIQLFVATIDNPSEIAVAMRPFDASAADLGTGNKGGKDTRQQEAKTIQGEGPTVLGGRFVTTLEKLGPFKSVQMLKPDELVPAKVLIVEGRFVTIDPGSRTKRYLAGFGAGKSSVKIAGVVKDADGRTLITFEQRRIGTMGLGGGDSLGKLMSDSRSIGDDIAKFLSKWARGESIE